MSQADELIKYKELLDSGIITQEEFNKKKAELFNDSGISSNNDNSDMSKINKVSDKGTINNSSKKVNSSHICWWIAFAIMLLGTIGTIGSVPIVGTVGYTVATIFCCPLLISSLKKININIPNALRIILVLLSFVIVGAVGNNTVNNVNNAIKNNPQTDSVFVAGTKGKDFFQNVLCASTQCEYRNPTELKADNMIPYDTLTYNGGNEKYTFEVITNKSDEIANVQMFFYNYGKEDSINYFMASTRLDYSTKNVTALTDFITNNIGKDAKITIGDFTFHFYKGINDNCIILDIYTNEFAKINGNT